MVKMKKNLTKKTGELPPQAIKHPVHT